MTQGRNKCVWCKNTPHGDYASGVRQKSLNTNADLRTCLLYTSDAADERSSVDLGGRRIIKKKKKQKPSQWLHYSENK